MTLPGLVPLMTRPVPLRRTSLNPGIHTLLTDHQEDTYDIGRCTYTCIAPIDACFVMYKQLLCGSLDKKQRAGFSLLRGLQSDVSLRQIRGASNHYPTLLQPTGHRVFSIYPNNDLESRCVYTLIHIH